MAARFKAVRVVSAAAIFFSTTMFTVPAFAEPSIPPPGTTALPAPETRPGAALFQADLDLDGPDENGAERLSSDIDRLDWNYVKGYATDTGKLITSPLRWESSEWLKFGMVVGGTASLFLVDQSVRDFAQKNRNGVAQKFADVGNLVGDPKALFPSVGAFYLYGQLADDSKARRASLLALESLTISGVITSGIKMVASRHRPNSEDPPSTWHGPSIGGKNVSFSSGHTSSAFAVATVMAQEYKDTKYVPALAYGLATLTGLARIYSDEHWSSDAFFGAALGHFVAKGVLSYHKQEKLKMGKRLSVVPMIGQTTGVTVNYTF